MKIYWSVILAIWTTAWITHATVKVGDSFTGGIHTWTLPYGMAVMCLFPALLGYLIGREKNA